jgi:hypothetical protein
MSGRKQVGTLSIKIRVRSPLARPEVQLVQEKVLLFDEHFPLPDPSHAQAPEGHVVLPASAVVPQYSMSQHCNLEQMHASSTSATSSPALASPTITSASAPVLTATVPAQQVTTGSATASSSSTSMAVPSTATTTATTSTTSTTTSAPAVTASATVAPAAASEPAITKKAAAEPDIQETDYNAVDFLISDKVLDWALGVTDKEIALANC